MNIFIITITIIKYGLFPCQIQINDLAVRDS